MIRIRTSELGKAYPLYRQPIDSLKEFLLRKKYHETVWAVRDVDLSVRAGAAIGIVGDNGAGKTTLLKLLAGALTPSCGDIQRHGRLSAILELGAGFHTDLSGAENIRIGCAVMGLSPAQTEERFRSIVEFSELESVLDRPVKTYSSGMFLRLAFSVATAVNPDILIVDEHLSVGDQHFRKKCMDRISRLLAQNTALVFCSHDLFSLREVCTECLWLRDGRPEMFGPTKDVLDAYQDYTRSRDASNAEAPSPLPVHTGEHPADDETRLRLVTLGADCNNGLIRHGGTLAVDVRAQISPAAYRDGVHVGVLIVRNDRQWAYGFSTKIDGIRCDQFTPLGGNEYGIRLVFEDLLLLAGKYALTVALVDDGSPHVYDTLPVAAEFKVSQNTGEVGMAKLPHRWEAL